VSDELEYHPKAGSVPWKVIKFLMANPDEELSRGDIAVKFDAFGAQLDSVLQIACARNVLKKARNREMEVVWMLGTNRNVVLDELVEQPVPDLKAAVGSMATAGAKAMESLRQEGFPEIRKNTPLMDEKTRRKVDFYAWLARFEVHDSAEFPEAFLAEMRSMVKGYGAEAQRQFNVVKVAHGRWGVERTA
jgi:hypothetical protein